MSRLAGRTGKKRDGSGVCLYTRLSMLASFGYFAPQARAPRMDLGPELSPADYEARHVFERGLKSYLELARRPSPPVMPLGQDPAYQSYYSAVRELESLDPRYGAELVRQAAIVGHMADQRRGRRLRMRPPPPLSQSPYVALPLPPGYSASEVATIGMPIRYWGY